MLLVLQHLTLCIVAFFKLLIFSPHRRKQNVTKKRCLLNKHSLFLCLFLVYMNTRIQTGRRFEISGPYSNTECSSICSFKFWLFWKTSMAEMSPDSRVQKWTELLHSSGKDFWFEFLKIWGYKKECPIQPIGYQDRMVSVTGQVSDWFLF